MLKILVMIGSTRQGRFSDKPADWIFNELKKRSEVEVELADLRDYPLPFYDEPVSPSMFEMTKHIFSNEVAIKWTQKVAEGDGFIIISPEYNHGYTAVLKNALDYVMKEWKRKAVGFVSYGTVGGARAIEQLRQVVIELEMFPIKHSINIPSEVYKAVREEKLPVNPELFKPLREGYKDRLQTFLDELIWSATALKTARENEGK